MKLEKYAKKVPGKRKGDIFLFAISTCPWCRRTKNLLNDLGFEYSYIDVDLLDPQSKREVVEEVARWNPSTSYPTIVINNNRSIVGFQEDIIRQAVSNGN